MFIQRAIVTLTLGPLALYLVYLGGLFYFLSATAVLLIATLEYIHIIQEIGWRPSRIGLILTVLAQLIVAQWPHLGSTSSYDFFAPTLFLCLLGTLAYGLWLFEFQKSQTAVADWLSMVGGLLLMGWISSHLLRIRNLDEMAWQWTIVALMATWIADTGAYLVGHFLAGRILGHHQLTPHLSPKKTVEGYLGGIVLSIIFTTSTAYILSLPLTVALLISAIVSIVGPLGDLGISMLKRQAGVKDSGVLFPGHGGALDRIDSLIWSVSIAYYVILFLG